MKYQISHIHRRGGFTLIEAIVAVTVLSIAIVGPISLSASSIRGSREAVLELEATHLAQEGIEVIHSIRSNNSANDVTVAHSGWLTAVVDIVGNCAGVAPCAFDVTDHSGPGVWKASSLFPAPTLDSQRVFYNPATGLYKQRNAGGPPGGWDVSPFHRNIVVTVINPNRQIRVTSTVTYPGYNGQTRSIVISDDLYNWFPCLSCP